MRIELFFQFPLEQVTEVKVLGQRLSNFQIDKFETVAESICFLSFQVPIKWLLLFRYFSLLMSLYILFCSFRPKSPKNADNESCLIENP